uniref:1-alkyl-2-acetylglycerophosphocholine esterase n=1 Tax=Cyprinus carpio TaxID=7962 RepID=A0A8C1WWY5_CYPCA
SLIWSQIILFGDSITQVTIWDTGNFGVYKNPAQHVPLQESTENLKDIEKECLLKGSALNWLNSVVGQYVQACVQAARQSGVDVLDLWTLMQKDGQDFSVYLSDALHLSDKGNQFVAEHFWTLLERRVTDLPFILPYWGDEDSKCPESSLLCD